MKKEIEDLLNDAREGNSTSRASLIELLAPKARALVSRYLRSPEGSLNRHLRDDLIGHAQLEIVQRVDRIIAGHVVPDTNVYGYIISAVYGSLRDAATLLNGTITIPRTSKRRAYHTGREFPGVEYLEDIDELSIPNHELAVDLLDIILANCKDDIDRQIVILRQQKESCESIAEIIGDISLRTIQFRLDQIEQRVDAALAELKDA